VETFTVTVGTIMMQRLEHVDRAGGFGNMVDLLLYMRRPENRQAFKNHETRGLRENFLPNTLATALLAGQGDKERLASILDDLNRF